IQAEDGIRDFHVTGVQTCALPILVNRMNRGQAQFDGAAATAAFEAIAAASKDYGDLFPEGSETGGQTEALPAIWENKADFDALRSEERRVGKECRIWLSRCGVR